MSEIRCLCGTVVIPDVPQGKAPCRRRRTRRATISLCENPLHVFTRPSTLPHIEKRPRDDADHVVQKRLAADLKQETGLIRPNDSDIVQGANLRILLSVSKTKAGEIVSSSQPASRFLHRHHIQLCGHMQFKAVREYISHPTNADGISIRLLTYRVTCVKPGQRTSRTKDGKIGRHLPRERVTEPINGENAVVILQIKVHDLMTCVNTRIRSAGPEDLDGFHKDPGESNFQDSLNGSELRLSSETMKVRPVVGYREHYPRHGGRDG